MRERKRKDFTHQLTILLYVVHTHSHKRLLKRDPSSHLNHIHICCVEIRKLGPPPLFPSHSPSISHFLLPFSSLSLLPKIFPPLLHSFHVCCNPPFFLLLWSEQAGFVSPPFSRLALCSVQSILQTPESKCLSTWEHKFSPPDDVGQTNKVNFHKAVLVLLFLQGYAWRRHPV